MQLTEKQAVTLAQLILSDEDSNSHLPYEVTQLEPLGNVMLSQGQTPAVIAPDGSYSI